MKREPLIAYLLWFFGGWLGLHRIYCRRYISGFFMIACFFVGQLTWMFFVGIPFLIAWGIWWFIDLFLIMGWIEEINKDISLDGYDAKIKAVNDLYELYKSGAITQSEYETRKDILLK